MNKVRIAGTFLLLGHFIIGGLSLYTYFELGLRFLPSMIIPIIVWVIFAIGFYNLAIAFPIDEGNQRSTEQFKDSEPTSPTMVKLGLVFVVVSFIAMLFYLSTL